MNNYWQEPLRIGNLSFPRFMGGPLDGITDAPFRKLVRTFSSEELLYTEMRHVACVANDKTGRLSLDFDQSERPLNYQVAANGTKFIERAIERIVDRGVDIIDLNVGCPAKNVVNSGGGSSLMDDPAKLEVIVTALRRAISIPFTVKIRAGFKAKNAIEIAKLIEGCGADALAIHPRLRTEFFQGRPDYALAAQVKQAISIPVLLSGNVVNWPTARMAYEQTGVDGFLIGRGIWAKPWQLKMMRAHSLGQEFNISKQQIFEIAQQHLQNMLDHYGEHGLYCFRKHLPFYVKGFVGASAFRTKLITSTSIIEVQEGLKQLGQSIV
ncbi:tRNA-dihydrouridine synthase [bacterium]|jgi:tRNA-dihydrouridine synthase B|nr:tRNA-dihydrouridine synthase [bacterium]MBT3903737.1 tRNA-dihydrouridine synthase [bacterium]MBT5345904.1 tRNA-dihydrouridine synthase [bacterium]MBT6131107.1 tRNA-dihydrouridine synthase [bacterium]MBT6528683.1 tRNA-dihydrouridine synthase [bacterium]